MPLHLTTLGRLHLQDDDGTELRALLAQPKRLAVLAYLALQPDGRFARRDTLLGLFWPELPQERARVALRKALYFIRQSAGAGVLVTRGVEEVAAAPGAVLADATRVRAAAASGKHDEALALYGGDFLPGFFIAGAPGFEQWADAERDSLRATAAASAWAAATAALDGAEAERARAFAERAMSLSPEDEGALRRFMGILGRAGNRPGALAAYRAFAAHLEAEYGIQPSAETQALVASLRAAPSPALPPIPRKSAARASTHAAGRTTASSGDPDDSPHPPGLAAGLDSAGDANPQNPAAGLDPPNRANSQNSVGSDSDKRADHQNSAAAADPSNRANPQNFGAGVDPDNRANPQNFVGVDSEDRSNRPAFVAGLDSADRVIQADSASPVEPREFEAGSADVDRVHPHHPAADAAKDAAAVDSARSPSPDVDADSHEPRHAPKRVGSANRPRRLAGWRWAAALAATAVTATATLALRRPAAEDGPPRIAILPFDVTGPSEIAYLENGLPVLLSTRLDGAGHLHAVAPGEGGSQATPASVAQRLGMKLYVVGTVSGAPGGLRISAALYDRSRGPEPVATTVVDGKESDLHGVADRLATELLAGYLHDTGAGMAATAARTTSSPEALKAWLHGEDDFREGRYEPAVAAFSSAIREDSAFALAYYRLAVAASWAGRLRLVIPAAQRAVALEDRLSTPARTMANALLALRLGRNGDAERLYRQATVERPDDPEPWYELGEAIFHGNPMAGEPLAASRHAFEEVLRLDPRHFPAMVHLARLAAVRGDTAELDRLTATALRGEPDGTHRAELLMLRAVGLGDRAALAAASALRAEPATLDALWRTAEYAAAPGASAALAARLLRATGDREMRASLHLLLAYLEAARGCAPRAEAYLDSLSPRAPGVARSARVVLALGMASAGLRWPAQVDAPAEGDTVWAREAVYAGLRVDRVSSRHAAAVRAALALQAGDSLAVREAAARLARHSDGSAAFLDARLASGPGGRARALGTLRAADSTAHVVIAQQTPLFPRALVHLAAADLLARDGRAEEALGRLSAVPEDLGFNVPFQAAVLRRRAALHRALGHSREAKAEDARARAVWTGCPAPRPHDSLR